MSHNVITCDYMDEAPGHARDGSETEHEKHVADPDLADEIDWEDGNVRRRGHVCRVCHHIVDETLCLHTDPRLDDLGARRRE